MRDMRLVSRILLSLVLLASLLASDVDGAGAVEQAPFAGRWIDVSLSTLTATAYQGSAPIYSAPITAGKKGFATPTGTFRIYRRVSVTDMRSSPGDPEEYFVKDVQYVQYFKTGGFAIHANYWQPDWVFGRAFTSHGCVSMRAKHARYFWSFASIGTPVYIHFGQLQFAVPKVTGKSLSTAKTQLENAGFNVAVRERITTVSPADLVVQQSPAGGKMAVRGSTVTIFVSVEPKPTPVPYREPIDNTSWAPKLVGLTEVDALEALAGAGLKGTYVNYVDETDLPASKRAAFRVLKPGTVVAALTPPDAELPRGADYMIVVKR